LGLASSIVGDALPRRNKTERAEPFRVKGFPVTKNLPDYYERIEILKRQMKY